MSFFSLWLESTCQMRAPRPWWWTSGRQLGKCWTAFWISPTVATAQTGLWLKPSPSYRWVSEQLQLISVVPERNKRCLWFVVVNTSEADATFENRLTVLLFLPHTNIRPPGQTTCTVMEICRSNIEYVPCFSLFQNVFLRIMRTWWRTYSTGLETATTSSCSPSALKNTLFSRTLRWPPIKRGVVLVTMEHINAGSICCIQKPIVYAYWEVVQLREHSSVFV